MKKTIIKAFVVLACMTLGVSNVPAQTTLFFQCEDDNCKNNDITIIETKSNSIIVITTRHGMWQVKNNLKKDPLYYENGEWKSKFLSPKEYEYDSYLSTSSRDVYKRYQSPSVYTNNVGMWLYYALSKDRTSLIEWCEQDNGIMCHKFYSIKISKDDLLPKAANYDFLNE